MTVYDNEITPGQMLKLLERHIDQHNHRVVIAHWSENAFTFEVKLLAQTNDDNKQPPVGVGQAPLLEEAIYYALQDFNRRSTQWVTLPFNAPPGWNGGSITLPNGTTHHF